LNVALPHTQETGVPYDLELEFIRPDGTHGWMRARGEVVRDAGNAVVGLRGVAEDITARKAAEVERVGYLALLEESLETTVGVMATVVELRDPYTAGHEREVARLAVAIATELGLDEDVVTGVRLAATVHDIGKIGVPTEILNLPRRLTPMEFALVKDHARLGAELLGGVPFPWPLATMVLEHHERCDGSGYPAGLVGDEISLGARIIAVADVVESMASSRPYRPGLGVDAALGEIEEHRGVLYDADVVDACLHLFREEHFTIDEAAATV